MDSQNTPAEFVPAAAKGPLQSKTVQLAIVALAASAVSRLNADAGAWIRDNADNLLALYAALSLGLRPMSGKAIDWRDWTLFGVGKKF